MIAHEKTIKRKRMVNLKLRKLLKCIGFIVLAFYLSVTLLDQQRRINTHVQETEAIRAQIEYANLQTVLLEEQISHLGTDEHIKRVARETLRLAMPGDRIYIDAARMR